MFTEACTLKTLYDAIALRCSVGLTRSLIDPSSLLVNETRKMTNVTGCAIYAYRRLIFDAYCLFPRTLCLFCFTLKQRCQLTFTIGDRGSDSIARAAPAPGPAASQS